MSFALQNSYLIPLLPLIAAVVIGLLGSRFLKGASHWPIWISVGIAAVLSLTLLFGMLGELSHHTNAGTGAGPASILDGKNFVTQTWFTWFSLGDSNFNFTLKAGVLIDALSVTMLCVVTGIGFLITVFAAGYMKGEEGYWRFFAYVGLFISAMTVLVMGDNLVLLYLGWEGVGLCSYLLIGYYYQKPEAREAAKKAFVVNRIGDLGFLIGILLTYHCFGTVSFFGDAQNPGFVTQAVNGFSTVVADKLWLVQLIPLCLMIGALGKSAQFPLFVWLPDAMAGPTPVSALIHAATMVTAGVYLCVRTSPLFYSFEWILVTLGVIGCFTAVFAGTISLRQYDLKKDFAYSTCSQLGFMFVAFAALSPVAAIFHLITHAFFKALLFLGSGVVSHSTGGVLDMRKMSGLKRYLPTTRWLMLIGCMALAGVPLITAGYYSKDAILVTSFKHSTILGVMMLLSALMTAYYTFRLYFRVFEGPTVIPEEAHAASHHDTHDEYDHGDAHAAQKEQHGHHNHEPWIMLLPLILLAVGSLFAGFIDYPHRHVSLGTFLGTSPSLVSGYEAANATFPGEVPPVPFGQHHLEAGRPAEKLEKEHALHLYMMVGSGVLALLGIAAASYYHLFNREALGRLSRQFGSITHVLEAKYYVDEIYETLFIKPYRSLATLTQILDYVVDGIVFIVGLVPQAGGALLRYTTQRGYLQGYAITVLLGLAVILAMMFL
jgi:NADH-quinone oxidoreductase subunit L